ncbi:MAG: signal peptidase I [Coriobacteriia bacterium]|nr:signal peptidase I [Coriobacteriia bacterium]
MVNDLKKDAANQQTNRPREDPLGNDFEAAQRRSTKPKTVWYDLGMLGAKIAAIALIGVALFTFVYGLHYNLDAGMEPAVRDGDLVVFYRWGTDYRAGDLAVVTYEGQAQVRRVVAVAGDTVDISERGLIINGSLQQERRIFFETVRYADGPELPLTLGPGEIFVLGDARENVADSRIYGAVRSEDTKGSVLSVLRRRNF